MEFLTPEMLALIATLTGGGIYGTKRIEKKIGQLEKKLSGRASKSSVKTAKKELSSGISEINEKLEDHLRSPGHPVLVERVDSNERTLKEVDEKINRTRDFSDQQNSLQNNEIEKIEMRLEGKIDSLRDEIGSLNKSNMRIETIVTTLMRNGEKNKDAKISGH